MIAIPTRTMDETFLRNMTSSLPALWMRSGLVRIQRSRRSPRANRKPRHADGARFGSGCSRTVVASVALPREDQRRMRPARAAERAGSRQRRAAVLFDFGG